MSSWDEDTDVEIIPPKRERTTLTRILSQDTLPPNPADWGWPPTMAMEIALRAEPPKAICDAYGIEKDEWDRIRTNPAFVAEVQASMEALRQDGAAFKVRAQSMATELLRETWRMIHDPAVPYTVRADLMKTMFKVAGLDASKDQGFSGLRGGAGGNVGLAIHINLGG